MSSTEPFDTGLRPEHLKGKRPGPVETPWGSFALFLVGERWCAVQSFCPHLQAPLFDGTQSNDTITCPWHQWRFSLLDGRRVDMAGQLSGGKPCLERLAVTLSVGGTLVLAPLAPTAR